MVRNAIRLMNGTLLLRSSANRVPMTMSAVPVARPFQHRDDVVDLVLAVGVERDEVFGAPG